MKYMDIVNRVATGLTICAVIFVVAVSLNYIGVGV